MGDSREGMSRLQLGGDELFHGRRSLTLSMKCAGVKQSPFLVALSDGKRYVL